jgi:F-type H+-transporting ATPase subunit epsilon
MAETTQLELVTPARVMVSKAAEMVVVPGSEGLFGVLPRHSALLASLERGVVEVYESGKVIDRFMIDGGLADVTPEGVTILAERAVDLSGTTSQELKERAANASDSEADFLNGAIEAL